METIALLQGLRFIDSFFPSGGYAYSSGLEAAVQDGAVRNGEELARYVEEWLRFGIGTREAVAVGLAHDAVSTGTLHVAFEADRQLEAMKIGRESRLASQQMGRQVIKTAVEQAEGSPLLREFLAAIEDTQTPGHLAVTLGLTLGGCGWSRQDAVAGFLYQSAVGFVSAGLKLLPIGQREGQRLLEEWLPLVSQLSEEAQARSCMTAWSPVQDIHAMRHSRLESRLFRS